MYVFLSVFFFQAEDGIRDGHVTGVQTCALPICSPRLRGRPPAARRGGPPAPPTGSSSEGRKEARTPCPHPYRPPLPITTASSPRMTSRPPAPADRSGIRGMSPPPTLAPSPPSSTGRT